MGKKLVTHLTERSEPEQHGSNPAPRRRGNNPKTTQASKPTKPKQPKRHNSARVDRQPEPDRTKHYCFDIFCYFNVQLTLSSEEIQPWKPSKYPIKRDLKAKSGHIEPTSKALESLENKLSECLSMTYTIDNVTVDDVPTLPAKPVKAIPRKPVSMSKRGKNINPTESKAAIYVFNVGCSFGVEKTFSADEVEQDPDGNEGDVQPTDKALDSYRDELENYLSCDYMISNLTTSADSLSLLAIEED